MKHRYVFLALVCAGVVTSTAPPAWSQGADYIGGSVKVEHLLRTDDLQTVRTTLSFRGLLDATLSERLTFSADVTLRGERTRPRPGLTASNASFSTTQFEVDKLVPSYRGERCDVTAGSQIVALGRTDGFVLLDRINARDTCEFSRLQIENKDPGPVVETRSFFGGHTLRTIVDLSGRNRYSEAGSTCEDLFNAPNQVAGLDDPGTRLTFGDDWSAALEYSFVTNSFDFSLTALSIREADFLLATVPQSKLLRPRTNWLGASFSAGLGPGVIRSELAYAPERDFTLASSATMELVGTGAPTDGPDSRWNALLSLGYEFDWSNWTIDQQFFLDEVESGPDLVREDQGLFYSLRLRKTWLNDKLSFQMFMVADFNEEDIAIRPEITYRANDRVLLNAGLVLYEDFGSDTGFFGEFEGRSVAFSGIEYEL